MALVERLHGQGGDWRVALFTHAGPAIDELSLSPGSAADAGHSESTASALLCRLDWKTVLTVKLTRPRYFCTYVSIREGVTVSRVAAPAR